MVRFEANKTRDKDARKFSRWIESREIRESIGKRGYDGFGIREDCLDGLNRE